MKRAGWVRSTGALCALGLVLGAAGGAASETIATLEPFTVQTDRFEDFGFRANDALPEGGSRRRAPIASPIVGVVREVWPNTAAAKAGLKPGDRLLKSDGRALTANLLKEGRWDKLIWQKFVEVRKGREVTWVLEIQSADSAAPRTIALVVPSAPPRWGASIWQPPVGRLPATVSEAGPLAERAREVLHSGVWAMLDAGCARDLGLRADGAPPLVGFYWDIPVTTGPRRRMLHRMFVTQQRGRTDVVLVVRSTTDRGVPEKTFLTSPSAALEKAWGVWDKQAGGGKFKSAEMPRAAAEGDFQQEVDFWLKRVGKVSRQWPLELVPEK